MSLLSSFGGQVSYSLKSTADKQTKKRRLIKGADANKLAAALKPVLENLESRQMLSVTPQTWVNDNWQITTDVGTPGLSSGDTVANTGPGDDGSVTGRTFGSDAFATIQDGIDGTSAAGTVHILSGDYKQNVVVNKSLELAGSGAANTTLYPSISGANTGGGSLGAGASSVILVQADNVSIHHLTIDGDNPTLTGPTSAVVNGADIDARNGIITDHTAGTFNNLSVHDATIKNIYLRGMYASSGGTFNFTDNTVDNVAGEDASIAIFNFLGSGTISGNTVTRANDAISANHSRGTTFTGNHVSQSASGIHTDNAGDSGGTSDVISGNDVSTGTAGSYGVWVFVPYNTVIVSNNVINGVEVGLATFGGAGGQGVFNNNTVGVVATGTGALVTTDQLGFADGNVNAIFIGNTFTGGVAGVAALETGTSAAVANVSGGSITAATTGVDATDGATVNVNGVAISGTTTGIKYSNGAGGQVINNNFEGGANPDNATDLLLTSTAGPLTGGTLSGNTFAGATYIDNHSPQNITALASSNTYKRDNTTVETDNAAIENRIYHKIDNPASGLVTWQTGSLFVTPAATPTATDNDYTRLANALAIATDGETITLQGTFDWTEANAAASWALGNDATAGTADDYSLYIPQGLDGVTITANSLGSARIQGPGDVPTVDLEGVFYFDGGVNQNWTISNLELLDFDNAIGMYFGAGGSHAFDGTHLLNNHIVVANDSTAATDPSQNIGIHFAFGQNQVIQGNTIDLHGDSLGTQVGMQSNTSGGDAYDGLLIDNNTINVFGAQAAGGGAVLGIWENAHGHQSDITVSNNHFVNHDAGNNPLTNLQRAFRVTSHSGATTTVTYSGNTVDGANIGFQWIAGSDFSGNSPVEMTGNTVTNSGTAVLIQSNGKAHLVGNDFDGATDNATDVRIETGSTVTFGANNQFAGDTFFIDNQSTQNINLAGLGTTFDETSNFRIEDKMFHKVDDATKGLITWVANNVYVTDAGTDHSIQRGVDVASAGDTVNVEAGAYKENIAINKSLSLLGPKAAVAGRAPARGTGEAVITTNGPAAAIIDVTSPNVTIKGFTLEGDDPDVNSPGTLTSGADSDVLYGVRAVTNATGGLDVSDNIVRDVFVGVRGDATAANASTANLIKDNWFDSVGAFDFGYAVTTRTNFYADVVDNLMTRVHVGVLNLNHFLAGPSTWSMAGNEIHSYAAGLWHNGQDSSATRLTVNNNDFTAETGALANNIGVLFTGVNNPGVTYTNNDITGQDYGMIVWGSSAPITLDGTNTVTGRGTGLYVTDNLAFNPVGTTVFGVGANQSVAVTGMKISGVTTAGIRAQGGSRTTAVSVSGTPITLAAGATGIQADNATLTIGSGDSITGGTTGVAINGASSAVTGNTLSNLSFTGQSGQYIALSNNALDNQDLDATAVTFDGKTGATATDAQNFAIEDKIYHEVDDATLGFVRVKAANVFVTQNSGSVQRGVDSASPADTVNVGPGTFVEQVDITKDLTLTGQGNATVIKSPATLATTFTSSGNPYKPIVGVRGATATVKNLTIDGDGQGNANNRFVGLAYFNAGGLIDNVTVTHVRNNPLDGVQHGLGIYVRNNDAATRAITISNNTVTDYQKNGITVDGAGITADILNNTVTGAGATGLIAQNGVQVSRGAVGHITGNTISGNDYTHPEVTWSAGVLLFQAGTGTTVNNNTLSNNDAGVTSQDHQGMLTVSGNTLTGNQEAGISVDQGAHTITNNTITGGNVGIWVNDAFAPTANTTATISGNTVSGATTGIIVADYNPADAFTVTATVAGNQFDGGAGPDNGTDLQLQDSTVTIGANNHFAGDTFYIDNPTTQSYDLSSNGTTFDETNNFRIEDKMHHRVDTDLPLSNGLITWVPNNVYITNAGTDHSIQRGVDAASPGDTVNVEAGTYAESVDVNKQNLTISGAGVDSTIIDVTGHQAASDTGGIAVTSTDGVTLQGFTVTGSNTNPPRYGIKSFDSDGLTIQNVKVQNIFRSGIDLNGVTNATLDHVQSLNNGGAGIFITDSHDVALSNITTSGNPWTGVSIATLGHFAPLGTSGIVFSGVNSFGESGTANGGLQLEQGNFADPAHPKLISWSSNSADNADVTILPADFGYALSGHSFDNDNVYVRFYKTLAQAQAAAAGNPDHINPGTRYIQEADDSNGLPNSGPTDFYVFDNAGNTMSIQAAVDAAVAGDTVNVAAGTFNEDVNVNKASLHLLGAGPANTTISGVIGGDVTTVKVSASNVEVAGFTITRDGNNLTDWNNPGLNSAGVAVQGTAITGMNVHDNVITGNRTGIDVNNSNGHSIHNNVISDNRTGLIFRNQTDNIDVTENSIANNFTVGVLFLDGSVGTNSPVQSAAGSRFFNNNISGNWYGQIVDRQSGGSLPAPGSNVKDFSGNWLGTNAPIVTTANSTEPGYAAQIPVMFGGTATAPGGQPDIAGPASANFDYTPYLDTGADTNVETAPGRGTFGFQGDFSKLHATADGAQTGTTGRLTEAVSLLTDGGTLIVHPGAYTDNLDTTSKSVTVSPGLGAAQITLNGDLTLDANDTLEIELNGPAPATDYDNLLVNGAVSLGGATLHATRTFTPAPGQSFTLIKNDGADPVAGTFAGLPEGATLVIGGVPYTITYQGGDGNDVVLTVDHTAPTVVSSQFHFENKPQRITIQFSENVKDSLTLDDITLVNQLNNQTISPSNMTLTYDDATNTATITFHGIPGTSGNYLPDGRYKLTVSSAGVTDAAGNNLDGDGSGGDHVLTFFQFGGDANRDQTVDFNDLVPLAQNYNSLSGNETWATGDFNYDGNVDFNDLTILAQNYNTTLPPVPTPAPAPAPVVSQTQSPAPVAVVTAPAQPTLPPQHQARDQAARQARRPSQGAAAQDHGEDPCEDHHQGSHPLPLRRQDPAPHPEQPRQFRRRCPRETEDLGQDLPLSRNPIPF